MKGLTGSGAMYIITVFSLLLVSGPVNEFAVSKTSSPDVLRVSWSESTSNPCLADRYFIRYNLINRDQCMEEVGETIERRTDNLMVVLDNLYPYSTYNVSVTAINPSGESMAVSKMQTTHTSSMSNINHSKSMIVF